MKELIEALKKDKSERTTDILNLVLNMVGRGDSRETIFELTEMLKNYNGMVYDSNTTANDYTYHGGQL